MGLFPFPSIDKTFLADQFFSNWLWTKNIFSRNSLSFGNWKRDTVSVLNFQFICPTQVKIMSAGPNSWDLLGLVSVWPFQAKQEEHLCSCDMNNGSNNDFSNTLANITMGSKCSDNFWRSILSLVCLFLFFFCFSAYQGSIMFLARQCLDGV